MYAVIRDGGRQYTVREGQELAVDFRDVAVGTVIEFGEVLACGEGASLKLGKPLLSGAKVSAEVLGLHQGPKLVVQKFRRRKNARRRTGHRQIFTKVQITGIQG